jgi:hypothetical protein
MVKIIFHQANDHRVSAGIKIGNGQGKFFPENFLMESGFAAGRRAGHRHVLHFGMIELAADDDLPAIRAAGFVGDNRQAEEGRNKEGETGTFQQASNGCQIVMIQISLVLKIKRCEFLKD